MLAAIAAVVFLLAIPSHAHQAVDPHILGLVPDRPADEIRKPDGTLDNPGRIRRGRDLFFNGTFGGNGRTCGTCHPATNNFTIDPAFIATLPQTSPLFVAENVPALAGLENPALMRQFGLILENLDGFNVPGVMRSVPHTLALRTSITPDAGTATRPAVPLANATGWSGDGAPNDGAFVNFFLGAIVQHFPKTLQREVGVDFRLPSKQQLQQAALFQLSLGRQADISLDGNDGTTTPVLVFADPNAEAGRALFVGGVPGRNGNIRSCNGCHDDASANDSAGNNRMFDTGVARHPNAPACRNGAAPGDGGFGPVPVATATICSPPGTATFRGNGQFITQPVIEASDSGPWFHNNIVGISDQLLGQQIERAIEFYETDAFNDSPNGGGNAFIFNATQVNQLGALLRALNARENVRNAIVVTTRAVREPKARGDASIREARSEVLDALRVLQQAPVPLYAGTNIVALLTQAGTSQLNAIGQNGNARRATLNTAIARLRQVQPQFTQ